MSNNIIQETELRDIINVISTVGDYVKPKKKNDKVAFTSLTRSTNNLVLTFPALCTKGISIETASMISKAIEKNCVTLLQMLFASIQITSNKSVQDYISQFHTNISVGDKITVDDFIDLSNAIAGIKEGVEAGEIKVNDRKLFEESMKNINNIAKVDLNEYSLTDIKCHKTPYGDINAVLETTSSNSHVFNESRGKSAKDRNKEAEDMRLKDYMSSQDIKKANELTPTKVMISFKYKPDDNSPADEVSNAIIGVKCKLYPVDSMEIIERISTKYADTNWLKQAIRASTGEISFLRDFILGLDRAKIDAINTNKRGSAAKMFRVLERRASIYKLGKHKANRADSSPITTLIVSQDEVEYLKKDYDIDLENRNIALKLMSEYNFMGMVIVDEPAESASFLWDAGNDSNYETLSFRNLERESDDKNYRKVINLMTKISR